MSKLLDFFIIFYFILFLFLEGGEDKGKHLSGPRLGRCLDATDAGKKKKRKML